MAQKLETRRNYVSKYIPAALTIIGVTGPIAFAANHARRSPHPYYSVEDLNKRPERIFRQNYDMGDRQIITQGYIEYLRERFSRADGTLSRYQNRWKKVKNYMESHNIPEIDASVCRNYLLSEFDNRDYQELTNREKETIGIVNILLEFLETGAVQPKKEQINLDGPIGALMIQYLAFKKDQRTQRHKKQDKLRRNNNRYKLSKKK